MNHLIYIHMFGLNLEDAYKNMNQFIIDNMNIKKKGWNISYTGENDNEGKYIFSLKPVIFKAYA